jgi:hypothetical protein
VPGNLVELSRVGIRQRTQAIDTLVLRLAKVPLAVEDQMDGVTEGASTVIGATLTRFPVEDIESYAQQAVIYCFCLDEVRQQRGKEWIRSQYRRCHCAVA